jgi:pimeloyl-ACP methyl ester carboxylesterase
MLKTFFRIMKQSGHIIQKEELKLEYFTHGEGTDVVICLHGHGRSAKDFNFIQKDNLRVISINLFFHGKSEYPLNRIEKNTLKSEEFASLFKALLDQEKVDQFHLFAFSQGGRFTLCTLPFIADRVKTLTLISPDGMDNMSFYNWSSRQGWARALFRRWERNPEKLKYLSSVASKIGLMRPKVKNFVKEFTSSKKTFIRASRTWRGFRNLQPSPKKTGELIKQYQIPFTIIMGSYDQVIRPKQAYAFVKKCDLENVVVEIQNGHNFFKESSINKFKQLLPFLQ